MTNKYYSLHNIDKHDSKYKVIFGERSNGKTTAALEKILRNWIEKHEQGAYIRRYDEEIKGSLAEEVWSSISFERGLVELWTAGEWEIVKYYNGKWYLAKWDEKQGRYIRQSEPFCYAFSINRAESYKGTSYPLITTILFDEFITNKQYIINEFVHFSNLLSTIIRQRDNVTVYMMANTVNKYNPYFDEFGLHRARTMAQGSIDIYSYENSPGLKVAVEYCESIEGGKKSDVYFGFENSKLSMITTGTWEVPMYPHAPFKIKNSDVLDHFFIEFSGALLQGDIVLIDDSMFIYVHYKTTPLRDDVKLFYGMDYSPKLNHSIGFFGTPKTKMHRVIANLINTDRIFFQDNEVGEMVKNYIMQTVKSSFINL